MDYGHWLFNVDFNPEDWFGFIYIITELDTGRKYIGKKQFFNTNRKVVKGKKNKKKVISESNWRIYTGSSKNLNFEISIKGNSNYIFEILSLHNSKGSLHYAEVEYQITHNVLRELLDDGITKKYFNRAVSGVKFIPPAETMDESRISISKILAGDDYTQGKMTIADYDNWFENHHTTISEEVYGFEKTEKLKKLLKNYSMANTPVSKGTRSKPSTPTEKSKPPTTKKVNKKVAK